MANEFVHKTVGTDLAQAEWEAIGAHVFNNQAMGDIAHASSATQISRLAIGSNNDVLHIASGIPAWSATLAGLSLTSPTITTPTMTGGFVANEGGADVNHRFESNDRAYMLYIDGGKDSIVIGGNGDESFLNRMFYIARSAKTAAADQAYADLWVAPVGSITIPAGTAHLVCSAYIAEPEPTATGTITLGCCLRIPNQPTEGTENYGLSIGADIGFDDTMGIMTRIAAADYLHLSAYNTNDAARKEAIRILNPGGAGETAKIGFFATAPIIQPAGIAVTAGGIHAALVSLGLITA